jgi:Na+/H+ antiporter NhaD/arsenite permease-like protein
MPATNIPVPILWVTPFALLLLAIATLPLAAGRLWARSYPVICLFLALPVAVYFSLIAPVRLGQTILDYVSFIALLGSLYVVAGGIFLEGGSRATPIGNTIYLGLGATVANLIGTTGASMLLIRPLIRVNRNRGGAAAHVYVFFIFLVSNIGGSLTPLGDPPLFLGYLEGVPFSWTFRLFPVWLTTVGAVLAIFFLIERYGSPAAFLAHHLATLRLLLAKLPPWLALVGSRSISPVPAGAGTPAILVDEVVYAASTSLRIRGKRNLWFLIGIIGCVFLDRPLRELGMGTMAISSYYLTPEAVHDENEFSLSPIREVAILFAGIFMTMLPTLIVLEQHGGALGVSQPWEFFWMTGALSSFLDNAPTYLTFLSAGRGLGLPREVVGVPATILSAISCGAVFMGANSYIGNGPNFMVKAIVEENGVEMPSFFGYMAYSLVVLIPTFVIVTLIFFA